MTSTLLSVEAHDSDGVTTIVVRGDMDIATADTVRITAERAMHRPECLSLHLDLAGVSFCDSTGLTALVAIRNGCGPLGIELLLLRPSPSLIRVLEISGLDHVMPIRH